MNIAHEHGPARDLDGERTLIATFLHFPERIQEAFDTGLTVEHFSLDPHRAIVGRIVALDEAKQPIDIRTVIQALEGSGQLEQVGRAEYLLEIDRCAVGGVDVPGYARRIVIDAKRRQAIQLLDETKATILTDRHAITNGLPARHLATFTAITESLSQRQVDTWRLLNDVELMDLPDPEFLIDGILPRRGVAVVYGPSGCCKTTMMAGLQVSVATGRDWFGHRVHHAGPSVYVATEDPSGFKVRLRSAKIAAGLSLSQPVGIFTFPEAIDLRDPASVNRFTTFVKSTETAMQLIVVDTYAASMPGASENSSEDTTLAMSHAQRWRDSLDAAVVLVHHTNASGSRERGHTSMRGAADAMISMTPVDDIIKVECSKQRNAALFDEINLKLVPLPDNTGCVLRLASDVLPSPDLTAIQQKAFGVLKDTFSESGATKTEWQRACQDIAERSFHRATKVLVEAGFVRQSGSHFCPVGGAK
jgi:hypothetical protein